MNTLNFDPENTLAGASLAMTPKEAIRLGIGLCTAVEQAVGADGVHGGVWPGNITQAEDQVAIGPPNRLSIADMNPDELEFVSPEQFWSGQTTPASDVYSIALVLYTALNHGIKPYFAKAEDNSSEERADALQKRMKGETLPYPATAGRALGDVIRLAASFRAEERYATPGRLRAVLESLPEGAEVPSAVPLVVLSAEEKQNAPAYKVDKDFEPTPEEKPKKPKKGKKKAGEVDENMDADEFRGHRPKGRWILPAVLILIIIAALLWLLHSCQQGPNPLPITTEPLESPLSPSDQIRDPVPETAAPWESLEPVETDAPLETDAPVETDAPPAEPRYEFVKANVTWTQARDLAEQKGGHLVTIRSEEQLQAVIDLAKANRIRFVWLGAYRDDNGQFRFVTGDLMEYAKWDDGEPSGGEDYLLLWDRSNNGVYTYNDTLNDLIAVLPNVYRGKIAYIIQYDD